MEWIPDLTSWLGIVAGLAGKSRFSMASPLTWGISGLHRPLDLFVQEMSLSLCKQAAGILQLTSQRSVTLVLM